MVEYAMFLQVPGFRPGKKVPESILISYIGKDGVRKAIVESILKRTLPHAMSSVCSFCFFNLNEILIINAVSGS